MTTNLIILSVTLVTNVNPLAIPFETDWKGKVVLKDPIPASTNIFKLYSIGYMDGTNAVELQKIEVK